MRPLGLPGRPFVKLAVDYDVRVWGLGYSQVDIRVRIQRLFNQLRLCRPAGVAPAGIDDFNTAVSRRSAESGVPSGAPARPHRAGEPGAAKPSC